MISKNLALTAYFLPHITHEVMENWRFSTNTLNLLFVEGSGQPGQIHQPSINQLPCDQLLKHHLS